MIRRVTGSACLAVLLAAPLAAETIHGCVDQKGTLRIVPAAGACEGKEYAISFESGDPDQPIVIGSLRFGSAPASDIYEFTGGGVALAGVVIGGGGGGAGKAEFAPIAVLREVDSASAGIFIDVATGRHIPRAVITLGPGRTITLSDVLLTSWELATPAGASRQFEKLTIDFGRIEIDFDGETACFDRIAYKKC